MAKKLASPIIRHKDEGTKAAPRVVLYDPWGVPLPNADQRKTDIHGRELQPEADAQMAYTPAADVAPAVGADEGGAAAKKKAERALAMRQQRALVQSEVDIVRFRVLCHLYRSRRGDPSAMVHRMRMRHLWFPVAGDVDQYELRDGNAPAPTDRPKHLRRLNLAIDLEAISDRLKDVLRPEGLLDYMVRRRVQEYGLDGRIGMAACMGVCINALAPDFSSELRMHTPRRKAR